ncbi:MAG: CDP-alcohol phosphatidyltransferase family protein [Chitinivibrionales bacterium]|nr:CDP-alcohol phosphatidyltransferase family protein [Chitinivibrionales bacterium]
MNAATIITSTRPCIAIFFTVFFLNSVKSDLFNPHLLSLLLSLAMVGLIELSDAVDGFIARARHEVTRFGMIFDPICDSISRQTIFCTFMVAGIIPLWMFLLFLYRDGMISLIRIMCAIEGTVVAAKKSGKIKAVFQGVSIVVVLILMIGQKFGYVPMMVWGKHPGFWVVLLPAFFTVFSLFDYLIPNIHVLKKMMQPQS